jgi:GxxExxY protein
MMTENGITEVVIGCAIKVHRLLGPGLLESACEECVDYELGETDENLKTKAFAFNMRK